MLRTKNLKRMLAPVPAFAGAALLAGGTATAQHQEGYEDGYDASAGGTVITGQNGYYIPVADSQDGLVYTYADNALGIPDNPNNGGKVFVGSTGVDPADPVPFARSQKDVVYGQDVVRISYDMLVTKIGDPVTGQNVGSFSTQTVEGGSVFGYIDLVTWVDVNDATAGWNGNMVWFDANDVQLNEAIPEFAGLAIDHWYRRSSTYNVETNQIRQISVRDLMTGETFVHIPAVARYADGGAAGGPPPTGYRYFAGCSTGTCSAGNTICWDNLLIACPEDLDEDGDVDFQDLLRLLTAFGPCAGGCAADLDYDGDVDFQDLLRLLTAFGTCS